MRCLFGHRWVKRGVTVVEVYDIFQDPDKDPPSKYVTEFSLECEGCGLPSIRRVRGHWNQ